MAYIDVIQPEQANGLLKEIYNEIESKRGKLAEVHKIQSLNPQTITDHMNLYISIMFGRSPLSRAEREMMGVVVSVSNHCNYCIQHHSDALLFFWKNKDKVKNLADNYSLAGLNLREKSLCRYAELLTINKVEPPYASVNNELKMAGFSDREILDATLVIAYFNFVNRIVLSLGVEPEEDTGGYKY